MATATESATATTAANARAPAPAATATACATATAHTSARAPMATATASATATTAKNARAPAPAFNPAPPTATATATVVAMASVPRPGYGPGPGDVINDTGACAVVAGVRGPKRALELFTVNTVYVGLSEDEQQRRHTRGDRLPDWLTKHGATIVNSSSTTTIRKYAIAQFSGT